MGGGIRDRSGDTVVLAWYEEHRGALLAYARRLSGDRGAAEDVVQEAFLRAWRGADSLAANGGAIRGWLFTVVRNLVIDRARARAVRPRETQQTSGGVPVQRDHAQPVVDALVVRSALATLSEDHRAVLVEQYFRGRTVAETAALLGIAPGTVKSRSHHAMAALRRRFAVRTRPPSRRADP